MGSRLKSKVALITGAGMGIGREASLLFAEHGARVIVADINHQAADETVQLVQTAGGEAIAVSEGAIAEGQRLLAKLEGLWTAPEAAATVAALVEMKERGAVTADARILLVLTGSGLKNDAPALPPPVDLTGPDDDIATRVAHMLTPSASW